MNQRETEPDALYASTYLHSRVRYRLLTNIRPAIYRLEAPLGSQWCKRNTLLLESSRLRLGRLFPELHRHLKRRRTIWRRKSRERTLMVLERQGSSRTRVAGRARAHL